MYVSVTWVFREMLVVQHGSLGLEALGLLQAVTSDWGKAGPWGGPWPGGLGDDLGPKQGGRHTK